MHYIMNLFAFLLFFYYEVIDWETEGLYEPPFTRTMSDEELKNFYTTPLVLNISSNSVLTERAIRTDNEVASMSTSANIREGMVRAIMQDRKSKPKLESMSDVVG